MEEVICVRQMSKSYQSKKAVDQLNLSINRGEIFGLLGENGAGKSTSLECILGTKKYDSGQVSILSKDPAKERKSLYQKVGVQFQDANYPAQITVREICEETACLYKNPADWRVLLEQFGIGDKIKNKVKDLSGGERQRLFVIQALIGNPEVVFLDELTTGLDVRARREVWKLLETLKQKGMTILLTSHFMDEVEALCDRICIIKKGQTVFLGSVEEAKQKSNCENLEDAYLWFTEGREE